MSNTATAKTEQSDIVDDLALLLARLEVLESEELRWLIDGDPDAIHTAFRRLVEDYRGVSAANNAIILLQKHAKKWDIDLMGRKKTETPQAREPKNPLPRLRRLMQKLEKAHRPLVLDFIEALEDAENYRFSSVDEKTAFRDYVNTLLDRFDKRLESPDGGNAKLGINKKSPTNAHFTLSIPGGGSRGSSSGIPDLKVAN